MMRNNPIFVLFSCFLGFLTLTGQVWGQAVIRANSVTLNQGDNIILAGDPVSISSIHVNTGSLGIPAGDSIALMLSVNGDTPTRVTAIELPAPFYPVTQQVKPPRGMNFLHLSVPALTLHPARFGGGGGLLNDITIWPTRLAGGSSVGVVVADTFRTEVLYIDAAAFRVGNSTVDGLPSVVEFDRNYPVDITVQNIGIGRNTRPIEFFAKLDDHAPVLLGTASSSLPVQGSTTLQVPNFNLYLYYDYLQITNQFRYSNHTLILYAQEQGLANSVEVARFSVDASLVMPVELQHFSGWVHEDGVRLTWSTLSEANNSHFQVEKWDPEGGVYHKLAKITGMGFSTIKQTYQFTDYYPRVGKNLYRLVQVDYGGKEQVVGNSVEVTYVMQDQEAEVLSVFPNPFSYTFSLRILSPESVSTTLQVLTCEGKLIRSQEVHLTAGISEVEIGLSDIPAGNYLYQTRINGKQLTGKIVKQ